MSPASFGDVLSALGKLPEDGQLHLAEALIRASNIYWLRKQHSNLPQPNQEQRRLKDIAGSATRLLKLLGIKPPDSVAEGVVSLTKLHSVTSNYILTGLYKVATDRRGLSALDAGKRLATLLVLVSDLAEAATRAKGEITAHRSNVQSRNPLRAEGQLIYAIFDIYADLREHFPKSGPKLAFDRPLKSFVRTCLQFAVSPVIVRSQDGQNYQVGDATAADSKLPKKERTTDDAIRGHFNRWLAQRATKSAVT